jgi:class 3 adenylate cyclase
VSGVARHRRHRRAASSTVKDDHDDHHDEEYDSASFSNTCGGTHINSHNDSYDSPPPTSTYLQPVFDVFDESSRVIVAYVIASFDWACSLHGILHEHQSAGVDIVLSDCHGDQYTWTLQGQEAMFRGKGDLHDELYGKYQASMQFAPYSNQTDAEQNGACIFVIDVYPTQELREAYRTNQPAIYTACVGAIFFLMAFTILAYDQFVQRRNDKIIDTASRSHAILSSLFPSQVRDRLYNDAKKAKDKDKGTQGWVAAPKSTGGLKGFLTDQGDRATSGGGVDEIDQELFFDTKPLADLFPECTVMFADLAGFTAWSSVREPSQVFQLLETIYRAMDQIARRRRIFKVETVGDCYVAVCGLPDARKDHAVAMVRFAKDCVYKVDELTNKLEVALGPDTADLTVRIGIHSGPVTAGVLRGEKSRFQLFGDTVNTAARMESTGVPGKIHVSEETAALIKAGGKGHWVTPRHETVSAKGKGILSTYFVSISANNKKSSRSSETSSKNEGESNDPSTSHNQSSSQDMKTLLCEKTTRLIEWNVDILLRLLKEISAHRQALEELDSNDSAPLVPPCEMKSSKRAFDEVKEIIELPEFNPEMIRMTLNRESVELDESVAAQLRDYVTNIAVMYGLVW